MNRLMRTAFSGVAGLIIAFSLFLLMQGLLNPKQGVSSQPDANINFSFIKERVITPPPVNPVRPVKPEQKEAVTPPVAPPIDISGGEGPGVVRSKPAKIKATGIELYKNLPPTGFSESGTELSENGGLKTGIAPFYPRQALMNQTEGWVEVLIKINAAGQVTSVSVLNAEPRNVFNQAALQAVRKWTFHPKQVAGQAVPYQVVQKIEFTMDQ